jgi:hypothetical protein
MNVSTRIEVKFAEPVAPVQIPVWHWSATASRLPGASWVGAGRQPNNFTKPAGANGRSFELEQLIARIRTVLRKQGI